MESSKRWRVFIHPRLASQLEILEKKVDALAAGDPNGYRSHPVSKMFAAIRRSMREWIPRNPNSPEFRQGNTLGPIYRNWFRAKFLRRYRLFFRFSSERRIIIYVWASDECTLRKAGSKTDPYAVFRALLDGGEIPNSFDELLRRCKEIPLE